MLIRRFGAALVLVWVAVVAVPAHSAGEGGLAPHDVVAAQLGALQHNDTPGPDAGIARVWGFAHPANRLVTGPIERFARMIKGERYRILIDHARHAIAEVSMTPDTAVYAVTVTGAGGESADFLWEVRRVLDGEGRGAWRTIRVSPAEAIPEA